MEGRRDTTAKDHWSVAADNYNRIIHDEFDSFRAPAWIELIRAFAPEKLVLDVLDIGCGPGFFSILLTKAGHRATGVDTASGMLAHAAENAKKHDLFPLFLQCDC